MDNQYIVAIEIASSKIVGAVGLKDLQGKVFFQFLEEEKLVDCVSHGLPQNIEEISQRLRSVLTRLENRIPNYKIKTLFVGLGGGSLRSISKKSLIRLPQEDMIVEEYIRRLYDRTLRDDFKEFEPLDIVARKFVVDGTPVKKPIGTMATVIEGEFNLIVGKKQLKTNIDRIIDRVGYQAEDHLAMPICAAKVVLTDNERQIGCVLVDFGAETTSISIYKRGSLHYLFTLPFGSRCITQDLCEGLNIIESEAERKKMQLDELSLSTTSNAKDVTGNPTNAVKNYISARMGEIVANIVNTIKMAGFDSTSLPGGMVFIGGGAKLNNFCNFVENETQYKTRIGVPNGLVSISDNRALDAEYVNIVSLIAEGATKLRGDQSCCVRKATATVEIDEPESTTVEVVQPGHNPGKQSGFRRTISSWFDRIGRAGSNIISEESPDEDEEYRG